MTEQNIQSLRCIFDVLAFDVEAGFRSGVNALHLGDIRRCASLFVSNRREEPADNRTVVSDDCLLKLMLSLDFGLV